MRCRASRGWSLVIVVALASVVLSAPASATPGAVVWTTVYDGPTSFEDERAVGMVTSPDGTRLYVTGTSRYSIYNGFDFATTAYNTITGTAIWTKYYNGPDDLDDQAAALAISPDGSKLFVTGTSFDVLAHRVRIATVALNAATGSRLWTRTYSSANQAESITTSPDGSRVYVSATTGVDSTSGARFHTIAYDAATGVQAWAKQVDSPFGTASRGEFASELVTSSDGTKVFVAGDGSRQNTLGATVYHSQVVAFRASDGTTLWTKRYDGLGFGSEAQITVGLDDSKVFLASRTPYISPTGYDWRTIAFSATTGAVLWTRSIAGYGTDEPKDIRMSADGTKVFVAGVYSGVAQLSPYYLTPDFLTVAYNATNGATLWSARYDTSTHGDEDPAALAVSPDGARIYVTGTTMTHGCNRDTNCRRYLTVAHDARTGAMTWSAVNGGSLGRSTPVAVVVSPGSRRVYVTGTARNPPVDSFGHADDWLTIAYSAL